MNGKSKLESLGWKFIEEGALGMFNKYAYEKYEFYYHADACNEDGEHFNEVNLNNRIMLCANGKVVIQPDPNDDTYQRFSIDELEAITKRLREIECKVGERRKRCENCPYKQNINEYDAVCSKAERDIECIIDEDCPANISVENWVSVIPVHIW